MYPEFFIQPMREELTRHGVQELRTADDVDTVLGSSSGTVMVVVNSVCGLRGREGATRYRDGAPARCEARCGSDRFCGGPTSRRPNGRVATSRGIRRHRRRSPCCVAARSSI